MIYKTDYHIHSTFSDGSSAPEAYLTQAIAAGFKEIGFSDHLTLFKEQQKWFMDPKRIHEYMEYIGDLKKKSSKIRVKAGLEVDYFPGKEIETADFLRDLELDYIIGSVHFLGEEKTVDEGPEFYRGKNLDHLFKAYFDVVCKAARSGLFDIMGHCDLVRIYGYKPEADPEPLYRLLAKAMKEGDVVFEINTNGRNKPLADFYPDRRFLHIFREEGIPVCVNSDAHLPARLGQYFDEVYDLLRMTGFNEMAVFEEKQRKMVPF
jgi:histidinol-phosphatase (PHP family)